MIKAGASFHDKNRVRQLHKEGHPVDVIARMLSLKIDHVKAIVSQIEDGNLSLHAPNTGAAYNDTDDDEDEEEDED